MDKVKDSLAEIAIESFNMGLKVGKEAAQASFQAAIKEVSMLNSIGEYVYIADIYELLDISEN